MPESFDAQDSVTRASAQASVTRASACGSLTVAEFAAWRQAGVAHRLIDVREAWERELASLPEALWIPMARVPQDIAGCPTDLPLVIICHHGGRSQTVTNWLRAHGYGRAINLVGGIDAWSCEIDASVARY